VAFIALWIWFRRRAEGQAKVSAIDTTASW